IPALYPPSADADRPTGPAAAEMSAPNLMWPFIKPCMPSSFMMNIIRSVLLPPICGPKLTPETENGAGELQLPFVVRQVATPAPCSPPTMRAPFASFGMTATHFAPWSTSLGTPLSAGALVMLCTVSVARVSSTLAFVLSPLRACAQTNATRLDASKANASFPFVRFGIVGSSASKFDSKERRMVCGRVINAAGAAQPRNRNDLERFARVQQISLSWSQRRHREDHRLLARRFLAAFEGCSLPNTRAKILSTFFSCRCRSKAYSTCWRGTLRVISLSARISSWKFSPSFQERIACDCTRR